MQHDFELTRDAAPLEDAPLEIAVIIPTLNEAANVEALIHRLSMVLAGRSWEVVFVDDNSPDKTSDVVRRFARTLRHVRIVQRVGRRGLSSAVVEGMLATAAPILAVMDGDLQHSEDALPRLIDAIQAGDADIAIGTRYSDGGSVGDWDATRHRISRFATYLSHKVMRAQVSDPMSGFFAIRRDCFEKALPNVSAIGFKILLDLIASSPQPLKVAEIPYQFRNRMAGESKIGMRVAAEYLELLADKTIGRVVPIRLIKFLMVGGLGVFVHMAVLTLILGLGATFFTAQTSAVATAIAFNFVLNNNFTYLDRKLKGWRMLFGLANFYAISAVGAVANIGIATWMVGNHETWWAAAMAGILIGAVWNYASSSVLTWRK